jgi:type II secretory ATPase GspE/PulE/Tfp pilus assembly ATPase PilB-like protein
VAEENGMVRLREDGLVKAARGVTTIEEVLRTMVQGIRPIPEGEGKTT